MGLCRKESESASVVKMWLCEGVGLPRLCTPFEGEVAELRALVGPKNLRNFFRGKIEGLAFPNARLSRESMK